MKPMLCQPIDQAQLLKEVPDEGSATQQKVDGSRLLLDIDGKQISAYGRNGQKVEVPWTVAQAAPRTFATSGRIVLDGELVKVSNRTSRFFAFDLVHAGDVHRTLITPAHPFQQRWEALSHLAQVANWEDSEVFSLLTTATDRFDKIRMVRRLTASRAEGIIVRRLAGPYREGIRSHDVLKYKFLKTVDCVVSRAGEGGRRNFVLELVGPDGNWHEVGKVSALEGDGPGVRVGSVVTVRYLYATKNNRLFHPKYPILRTDKDPHECTLDQLVYTDRTVHA